MALQCTHSRLAGTAPHPHTHTHTHNHTHPATLHTHTHTRARAHTQSPYHNKYTPMPEWRSTHAHAHLLAEIAYGLLRRRALRLLALRRRLRRRQLRAQPPVGLLQAGSGGLRGAGEGRTGCGVTSMIIVLMK